MKAVFPLVALLLSSAIVITIIFASAKGIFPFLSGYSHGQQNIASFPTGMMWRKDQGIYGVGFIVTNTLVSAFGVLVISFYLSVLTALFIVKITSKHVVEVMTTAVELPASISSAVYGVSASGTTTVLVSSLASSLGFVTAGGSSLLAVTLLLAIMIFPTITSLLIAVIRSIDREVELGSLALDVTRTQTNFKAILTSVKSGIFAGAILDIDRASGEATAAAMVMGNRMFGPTVNVFDMTRTPTTTMLAGLKETTGLDCDTRFSVGLAPITVILLSNPLLNLMKKKVGDMKRCRHPPIRKGSAGCLMACATG